VAAYVRGAAAAKAEALRQRKEAALNAALRAEADLDTLLQAEHDLARAERRRDKALAELLKVRDKFASEAEAAEADLETMREARRQISVDARRAIAASEKLKRELVKAEEADTDLRRVQSERARNTRKLHERNQAAADTIAQINRAQIELPPPIYGGPEGLRAAAHEADTHWAYTHRRRAS